MNHKSSRRTAVFGSILFAGLSLLVMLFSRPTEADELALTSLVFWGEPRLISTTSANGAFVPVVATAPNGRLIVAFNHNLGSKNAPHYSQSTNGGGSWSAPAPIHTAAGTMEEVAVAFDSSNLAHAVWRTDTQIVHARENQWASNGSNTIVSAGEAVNSPDLAVAANGDLHVAWSQGDNLQAIYHAFSQDGGASWSTPVPLSDALQRSSVPDIVDDQAGNLHIVWEERVLDISCGGVFCYHVYYKKGLVSGSLVTWDSSPTIVSTGISTGFAHTPSIIAQGNTLHVGYLREVASSEQYAYYARYVPASGWTTPLDTTMGNPVRVNTADPFWLITTMSYCQDAVFLYYHGALDVNGREQVLGANEEEGWLPRDAVTSDQQRSVNPSMSCKGGSLQIVFEKVELGGTNQIYYVRTNTVTFTPMVFRP